MTYSYEELMDRHTELKLLCLEQSRHIALLQNARSEQQRSQAEAGKMIAELIAKVRDVQKLLVDQDTSAKWWAMHEEKIKRDGTLVPNSTIKTTSATINWDGRYGKST